MRPLVLATLLLLVAWPAHASTGQDDCGSGTDAAGTPGGGGLATEMPIDCDGALVEADNDAWDIYAVDFSEGPVYADLTIDAEFSDFDLCIIEVSWASGACSDNWGSAPEEIELWWPAGPAYVAVIHHAGRGGYHLTVRQQDDCGTGIDALASPAAALARAYVRCEAVLDVFHGDHEDAFLLPPPAIPDIVIVRMEPTTARVQLCVEDEIHALGLRSRCTDATFSRILVARDPLRPMRVTVEGFSVDPVPYTLIVENAAKHPPQMPPLL